MSIISWSFAREYVKSDLVAFTKSSIEMQRNRATWGIDPSVIVKEVESISLSDDEDSTLSNVFSEKLRVKDSNSSNVTLTSNESITLTDKTISNVTLTSNESITITDSFSISLSNYFKERMSVIDQDERLPNTVIYDFQIGDGTTVYDSFEEHSENTPLFGYSEVRPLLPGEYEYKDAIVGVRLSIPTIDGRFGIIGSTLNVDVEDVVEKGTVEVSNTGPSTVTFTKKFYTQPKILTSLVESNGVGLIEVTSVSKTGFTVALKSATNSNNYVDGTIDWLADGY